MTGLQESLTSRLRVRSARFATVHDYFQQFLDPAHPSFRDTTDAASLQLLSDALSDGGAQINRAPYDLVEEWLADEGTQTRILGNPAEIFALDQQGESRKVTAPARIAVKIRIPASILELRAAVDADANSDGGSMSFPRGFLRAFCRVHEIDDSSVDYTEIDARKLTLGSHTLQSPCWLEEDRFGVMLIEVESGDLP